VAACSFAVWRSPIVLIAGLCLSPATPSATPTATPSEPAALMSYVSAIRHSDPLQARRLAEEAWKNPKMPPSDAWRFRMLSAALILDGAAGAVSYTSQVSELLSVPKPPEITYGEAMARIASVQGYLAFRNQHLEDARDLYEEAFVGISSVGNDPCWTAELLVHHRAQTLRHSPTAWNLAKAADSLKLATSQAEACPDKYWQTLALLVQGNIFNDDLFYFENAVDSFQKCLLLARKYKLPTLIPNSVGNMALAYSSLGDFDNALSRFDEVDAYYKQLRDPTKKYFKDWGTHKGHRARTYLLLGKFDQAAGEYKEAMQIATRINDNDFLRRWQADLTSVYIAKGDYQSARSLIQQILSAGDKEASVRQATELNAARLARLEGNLPQAAKELDRLSQQIESSRENRDPKIDRETHLERAQVFVAMKNTREARREFKAALNTADSARQKIKNDEFRLTYFIELREIYQTYVAFLVAQGQPDEALRVAEMGHARLLAEKLHASKNPGETSDFKHFAQARKAVILSYQTAPARSYMWVTSADSTKMFELPGESQLKALIERHNAPILDGRSMAQDQEGRHLYEILIAPAAEIFTAQNNVIVIPDGPLSDLNFETLIPPGPGAHYWLESAVVTVAPSLTLLLAQEQPPIRPASILAVGDAHPSDPALPLLGDSELQALRKIYGEKCRFLKGVEATPAAFLNKHPEQFSLIHLSAHALTSKEGPLNSYFALSPDANNDYKLYAHDLSKLPPLQARLVTLSACQSARARNVPGEGLVGLAWAVLSAGASNVVASLWNVPAPDTSRLMRSFYSHLNAGEPPAKALHSAKLEIALAKGSTPYEWAAFQLYSR
jgi:FimV-like protein